MPADWKAKYQAQRELNNELLTWLNEWLRYEEDTSQCPHCCEAEDICLYKGAQQLLESHLEK